MSEEIIKVFDYIGDKLGIAIDYTKENITPYLTDLWNRYISYEIWLHIINIVIFLSLSIAAILIFRKYYISSKLVCKNETDGFFYDTYIKTGYYDSTTVIELTGMGLIVLIIACVLLFFAPIFVVLDLKELAELIFIPEKYILNELQSAL